MGSKKVYHDFIHRKDKVVVTVSVIVGHSTNCTREQVGDALTRSFHKISPDAVKDLRPL